MGRRLFYEITADNEFTEADLDTIKAISNHYNANRYKEVWSADNFWLDPYDHEINEEYFKEDTNHPETTLLIKEEYEKLEKSLGSYGKAVSKMVEKGYIRLINSNYKKQVKCYSLVQGNEYNSLLILRAMTELSILIPNSIAEIKDEGEFLLCPIKLRNGKSLPKLSPMLNSLDFYARMMILSSKSENNILSSIPYKFSPEFKRDIGIDNEYAETEEYSLRVLRNLCSINYKLIQAGLKGEELFFKNIEKRPFDEWFLPEYFSRPVNIKNFKNYKCSPATFMAGFDGEAFGLNTEDIEEKSYRVLADIKKQYPDGKVRVLGENK